LINEIKEEAKTQKFNYDSFQQKVEEKLTEIENKISQNDYKLTKLSSELKLDDLLKEIKSKFESDLKVGLKAILGNQNEKFEMFEDQIKTFDLKLEKLDKINDE
jgi:hypothetical protein